MLNSFEAIVTKHAKVLILGSMPSVVSLEKQEYYGFKHNRFWKIMRKLKHDNLENYTQKVNFIKENDFALWDVIATCERQGSLDSKIKKVVCNDIEQLLNDYPSINKILCNGKKASVLYLRYFSHLDIEVIHLPSTSNANRSISEDVLLEYWLSALKNP